MNLEIQRAHKSTVLKPKSNEPPRSIVINFQHYATKDRVLKAAWLKKIMLEDWIINFSHDFPTEVNLKLKDYKDIKRILKEQKVRFQTPYAAKMKIHWESGSRLYNSASEAAEDVRKRGYEVEVCCSGRADSTEPRTGKRLSETQLDVSGNGLRNSRDSKYNIILWVI